MKNKLKMILPLLTLMIGFIFIAGCSDNTKAKANYWHPGVPKIITNKVYKADQSTNSHAIFDDKHIDVNSSQNALVANKLPYYHKISSNIYLLKGYSKDYKKFVYYFVYYKVKINNNNSIHIYLGTSKHELSDWSNWKAN